MKLATEAPTALHVIDVLKEPDDAVRDGMIDELAATVAQGDPVGFPILPPLELPLGTEKELEVITAVKLFLTEVFHCQRCGACCTSLNLEGVVLERRDLPLLARRKGLSRRDFSDRYTAKYDLDRPPELKHVVCDRKLVVPCTFHTVEASTGKAACLAYDIRPYACRMWPVGYEGSDLDEKVFLVTITTACPEALPTVKRHYKSWHQLWEHQGWT